MTPVKWLFKTEPSVYSFERLSREKKTVWDGVTNALALKNLRQIQKGDLLFIFHTGGEKAVVGIAEAAGAPFPDPRQNNPRLAVVEIRPVEKIGRPVPLSAIKANPRLKDWELVRLARLSVVPVSPAQWKAVMELAQ